MLANTLEKQNKVGVSNLSMSKTGNDSLRLLEGNRDNSSSFSSIDTEELYQQNLATQPKDWYWRSRPLTYTLNQQRYRAPEWKDCDWKNSILFFGCSLAYGIGVDDSQTISHYLSLRTGWPVINLGQSGTGIVFAWANSIILKEHNITPKAVVYLWSSTSRQTEFASETSTIKHGIWDSSTPWMQHLLAYEKHNSIITQYYVRNLRQFWNCPVIEASFYKDVSELTGCIHLDYKDYARDLKHPGPLTTAQAAFTIYDKIPRGMR